MDTYDMLRMAYYKEWKRFMETGECDANIIRPMILESWKRCKANGVDPYDSKNYYVEIPQEFDKVLSRNRSLIALAKPHLDILAQILDGTGFIGLLASKEGYVLDAVGNPELVKSAAKDFIKPGAKRMEDVAGTTAIALCIIHKSAVQVFSAEHYSSSYLDWTCYAAPICDEQGELVGVLNLSGDYRFIHKHTFGIVIALAKAIENAIHLHFLNTYMTACIDSSEYGMAVVDNKNNTKHVNKNLRRYSMLAADELLGNPINRVLLSDPPMEKLLGSDNQLFEKSITVKNRENKNTNLLVNTKSVFDDKGELFGTLIITKEKKELHRLVHRMVGAYAMFTFADILGKSEKILRVIELAKKVAVTSAKVLIQGESGTGKELFAQAIHNLSPVREGPFISINCTAIPSELMESELFGYNEGAFTGARKGGMPGKFELAEGGTIFLDEIDSMPQNMQIKLLRVLEENKITRVGGNVVLPINVRIVAASGKNLAELVQEGRIRLDLYYRINTIILDIPPLRERKEDIPLLAEHMIDIGCQKLGYQKKQITDDLLRALMEYNWPGNIRELANTIERAIIIAGDSPILDVGCCDATITQEIESNQTEHSQIRPIVTEIKTLGQIEKEAIIDTLRLTNNNHVLAAQYLGIHRNTLRNKLREYSMQCDSPT